LIVNPVSKKLFSANSAQSLGACSQNNSHKDSYINNYLRTLPFQFSSINVHQFLMIADNINEITRKVIKEFGHLTTEQLNRKISAKTWSIGQCIDHIIVSNETYLPVLSEIAEGRHKSTFWEINNLLSNYTGRRMIKTLGLEITKKFKSPKQFLPSKSEIPISIIGDFKRHQDKMLELFRILENDKFSDKVITSPVAALITLRVKDVIEIIIVHEQRHLQQALYIKKELRIP